MLAALALPSQHGIIITDSWLVNWKVIRVGSIMEFADIAMTAAFLLLPPLLIFLVRNRLRGFVYSVMSLWLLMITGGQYHLAYTPNYDSIAPGISIVAGWIPASIY